MIDIGICAGLKSDNYIPILINSLKKKAKYPDNLNIIICKNETINISDDFLKKFCNKLVKVNYKDDNCSLTHSFMLHKLFENFNNEYGMFIDTDVIMMLDNWDVTLVNLLTNNIVRCGVPFGKKYRYDAYHINKPMSIFYLFKTKIFKKINIKFTPLIYEMIINEDKFNEYQNIFNFELIKNLKDDIIDFDDYIKKKRLSKEYPPGMSCVYTTTNLDLLGIESNEDYVLFDSSSQVPVYLHKHKYKSIVFDNVNDNMKPYKIYGDKYYFNDKILLIHLGGGSYRSNLAIRKWENYSKKL